MTNTTTFPVLVDGYTDLPPGKIANIVTFLERRRPPGGPPADQPGFTVRHVTELDVEWFRSLYRRIGERWLWFSALVIPAEQLARHLQSPAVVVLALQADGKDVGLAEIEFARPDEAEIVTFGVVPEALGTGGSFPLMEHTLFRAFRPGVSRVWLHTCTFDHQGALHFYMRAGFQPWKLAIEVCDDPRVTGALPREAARHVPLIAPQR